MTRRAQSLYRTAVYELARVLYRAETRGWHSLSLNPLSRSTPSGPPPQRRSGYVQFQALMPVGSVIREVDVMLTSREYDAALASLSTAQRGEIERYYLRQPAKGDSCPELERSDYAAAYKAFAALMLLLVKT